MAEWIKAHKFSIIYFVSFFLYPFTPALIYPLGDYGAVAVAVLIFLLQLLYIVWLRRKENVSLGRSIARFFLFLLIQLNVMYVCYFVNTFINGYNDRRFFWSSEPIVYVYYGFEAWAKDERNAVFFGFTFSAFAVYLALYFVISAAIRRSQAKK